MTANSTKRFRSYECVEIRSCGIILRDLPEYQRHCNNYDYRIGPERDFEDAEMVENPQYDPLFPQPTSPAFCKRMVGMDCLKNNCIPIAYCNAATDFKKQILCSAQKRV